MKKKNLSHSLAEIEDINTPSITSSSHIGSLLQKKRESLKIPLDKASQELCIRKTFLKAIEEGDTKSLPERVYTLGFVKSYASFLGLDKDTILLEYQKEDRTRKESDFCSFPDAPLKKSAPSYLSYFIGLMFLTLGVGLWFFFNSDVTPLFNSSVSSSQALNSTPTKTIDLDPLPPQPTINKDFSFDREPTLSPDQDNYASSSLQPPNKILAIEDAPLRESPPDAQATDLPPSKEASSLAPPPPPEIRLTAKERVWVQITNTSGVPSFTKTMQRGESYKFSSPTEAYLTIGNAGGLEISIDNKIMPPLGKSGQVIRNFSLNIEKFLEQIPLES